MKTIDLTQNWQSVLPALLMVYQHAETKEGRDEAFAQLKWMAYLADNVGKPLDIELYAMAGDTIAEDEPEYFDVWIRFEGGDPLEEFENIPTYEEAHAKAEELMAKYEGRWTHFNEIGG